MNSSKYLQQTEKAVKQLFAALQFYRNQLPEAVPPIFVSQKTNETEREDEFENWIEENKEEIQISLNKQKEYLGFTISNSTICGSIIQIAYMGIKSFSTNSRIHPSFNHLISNNSNGQKFCVGKEIRGVPIGLIIYAARNQYNHMDEKLTNKLSISVFDKLAQYHTSGNIKDPAFDLNNPMVINYSHNVLALLSWNDFENYLSDMQKMI